MVGICIVHKIKLADSALTHVQTLTSNQVNDITAHILEKYPMQIKREKQKVTVAKTMLQKILNRIHWKKIIA